VIRIKAIIIKKALGGIFLEKFKPYFLITILFCLFIVSFLIGWGLTINKLQYSATKGSTKTSNISEIVNINTQKELKVNKDTLLITRIFYKKCGHIVEETNYIDEGLIGCNKEDIENFYKGWTLEHFGDDYIIISRIFDALCPNHFIISIKDNKVAVLYSQPVDGNLTKLITPIDIYSLNNNQIEDLKKGIIVDTFEDALKIIEDFGS